MTPAIRAYRILSRLRAYKPFGRDDRSGGTSVLGDLLGVYRNPSGEVVEFFDEGVAFWFEDERVEVRYDDISKVSLPDEKESRSLDLALLDGRIVSVPILGGEGKFRDALGVLHFFNRVREDRNRSRM